METKGFFQFEIIINVLVSSFRLICYVISGYCSMAIIMTAKVGPRSTGKPKSDAIEAAMS